MSLWFDIKRVILIEAVFFILTVIGIEEKLLMWSHRNDEEQCQ
jgi:hypothetical protein